MNVEHNMENDSNARAIIVDDEAHVRSRISRLLKTHASVNVISQCENGIEAVQTISESVPDIVFLDIQMPGLDGFDVLNSLNMRQMPVVVFVTAFDQHAIRAFEMNAIDYVLKPIDPQRFGVAVDRALQRVSERRGSQTSEPGAVAGLIKQIKKTCGRLLVKSNGRHHVLETAEIHWIKAADKYVEIHTSAKAYMCRSTMREFETKLDPEHFVRIHRSTIVNINAIREILGLAHGDFTVVLENGQELTLSRSYKAEFDSRFHIGL